MNPDTAITCPECDADFQIRDVAVWNVCLTCGEIWPPGEQWSPHNQNDDVACDGFHSIRKYSEEAAKDKQTDVRSDD